MNSEDHFWVLGEVGVVVDRRRLAIARNDVRYGVNPDWMLRLGFVGKPLAEEQDVGGNRRVGVFLEGVVGQANCSNEIGPGGHRAAGAHVERIERVVRADADGDAARLEFVERLDEKVIVKR